MAREKYLVFSIVLAIAALAVLAAGIAAQTGIDWSQSSVVPSAAWVEVSDMVTFTVQVVNSSTVTAEDVTISNEIPDGTEFVSVTEGMLITTATGLASTESPAASNWGSNLEDINPADVRCVGWMGDIEPGLENMVAFDLVLKVKPDAGSVVTDTVIVVDDGGVFTEAAFIEIRGQDPSHSEVVYIPLVIGGAGDPDPDPDPDPEPDPDPVVPPLTQTKVVTAPLTRFYEVVSLASTITEAIKGEGSFRLHPGAPVDDSATVRISFRPYYQETRKKAQRSAWIFDVPDAVRGRRVLTTQLTIGANYSPLGFPAVPAIVSRASPSVLDPHDSVSAEDIYFGHEGEPWEWYVPLYIPGSYFAPVVTLSLPPDRLNWTEDEMAIHLRCGAEDRPDLWGDDMYYSHYFQWDDRYYIPTLQLSITNTVTSSIASSVDLR